MNYVLGIDAGGQRPNLLPMTKREEHSLICTCQLEILW